MSIDAWPKAGGGGGGGGGWLAWALYQSEAKFGWLSQCEVGFAWVSHREAEFGWLVAAAAAAAATAAAAACACGIWGIEVGIAAKLVGSVLLWLCMCEVKAAAVL